MSLKSADILICVSLLKKYGSLFILSYIFNSHYVSKIPTNNSKKINKAIDCKIPEITNHCQQLICAGLIDNWILKKIKQTHFGAFNLQKLLNECTKCNE